jgi:predicted glycosyltransferase involved in capsule biosynthesis
VHLAPLSKTNNFLVWCEKNGERGKKLLKEYVDPDKKPTSVTKSSHHKALWKCLKCKHAWRAMVCHRTRSGRPTGCPKCNPQGTKKRKRRDD